VSLKPQVLDRLLLSKSFLDRVRFQPIAPNDRHVLAGNIIAAHDAAELAIATIADELGCSPANGGKTYSIDYFDPIEKAMNLAAHGRDYFRQLNIVRNQLKYQGLFPDSRQWARVAESVHQHVTKWCSNYLKIHFGQLDESVLLLDADVKRPYDEAKQNLSAGNFQKSLEKIDGENLGSETPD